MSLERLLHTALTVGPAIQFHSHPMPTSSDTVTVAFSLAELVREEHDQLHPDPWAVCPHEMCRAAGALL